MEQFLLFGDSITQHGCSQMKGFALVPAIQESYIRRLDVINRGFSGYNTEQALKILPKFFPAPAQSRVRLLTIFFGANDARLPDTPGYPQTVLLEQFRKNIASIATQACVQAHNPQIIVITPPPVDERLCLQNDQQNGINVQRRTAANTAAYAEAVREVGSQLNLPVLDIWDAFMHEAGWQQGQALPGSSDIPQNEVLVRLLYDGLHLSPEGYRVMHRELMGLIARQVPDHSPERIPWVFPAWDDAGAWS
ncbi:hypothetical protein AAFC00_004022 [Neodothiora populina]|uniref:SGNH hydrolase-type esterase domain-containing protein n=1 Tax=Neodothiora populina TaxID=2781224 RepID=A0ABR3PII6_9PEZI